MNQKQIEILCNESPKFADLYQHYQVLTQHPLDAPPRVIVCGMYNAGKSSLLNAVTDQLETEYFKTGSARVTTKIQIHEMNGIVYLDTPGIDGSESDDTEAWVGIANGDFYLYAHNVMETEFSSQEANFLKKLSAERPDFVEHHLLVLTQVDRVSNQEELDDRVQSIKDWFATHTGFEAKAMITSTERYKNGVLNNKLKLRQLSGIDALKIKLEEIKQRHAEGRWVDIRKQRRERITAELISHLGSHLESKKWKKLRLELEQNQKFTSLQVTMTASLASVLEKQAELLMAQL